MIRTAIVDDETSCVEGLKEILIRYGREHSKEFYIQTFLSGDEFISDYTAEYDLVLMDIDMPHMNGLETAKMMRKLDSRVALIFITNLAKYAIRGYEVEAVDFVLKPVSYESFSARLNRILKFVKSEGEPYLTVITNLGKAKVYLADILYIKVNGRYVTLHTKSGEVEMRVSMKALEKQLAEFNFVRSDNSVMVNLMYVTAINGDGVVVNGEIIPYSRNRKKAVMDAFTLYLR